MEDERQADLVVAKLIAAAQHPETVEKILDVWGQQFDKTLGRAFRRALWLLLVAVGAILSSKFGILDKLFK